MFWGTLLEKSIFLFWGAQVKYKNCFLVQENVSCLNTTLVFLMFANRKNALPRYLQALRDEKEDMMEVSGSANLLGNFRSVDKLHHPAKVLHPSMSVDKLHHPAMSVCMNYVIQLCL